MDNPSNVNQHDLHQRIAELEATQARLQSECESLRKFYLQVPLAYQSLDIDGRLLEVNQPWLDALGYTQEEVIGKHFSELLPPEQVDLFAVNFSRFKTDGEIVGADFALVKKDGTRIQVAYHGKIGKTASGQFNRTHCFFQDITQRKNQEAALVKRLVALTSPLAAAGNISFEDLFDSALIQRIQDEFSNATGVAAIITRPDGTPITQPSNFTRLCRTIIRATELGRANCFKSDAVLGRHHPGGPIVQLCLSGGLWDAGASITVDGHHVANWLIGQVRNEAQDETALRRYAQMIGADEAAFIEAFHEVPSMSRERFESIAQALFTLANQLSSSAYHNLQQARVISERQRAEAALRTSEERFRLAMEATRDGLWDWDVVSGAVYYSPSYWAMLGYDGDTQPQDAAAWMEMIHPEDREAVLAANTACIENHSEAFLVEYRLRTKDGVWKWIQGRGKAVARGNNGLALRMVGTHVDISERKQHEVEQEKLKAQLLQSQKMESVARLAGGVAHDFNNMLMVIMGHADLALMTLPEADPSKNRFRAIREIVTRSVDLTRQLLAFARKQPIVPIALDLNLTIENMLSMLRRLIGEDITLTWLPGTDLWSIKADPSQIDQVLANLCINGRDAISGVGKIIVETSNCTISEEDGPLRPGLVNGEYVRISVADNGCGMNKDTLAHVFEPFFTTKAVGKGTGLGLATVYGIVKQNSGFVNAYSEPGQGTVFTLYFPRQEIRERVMQQEQAALTFTGGSETILVVEDEVDILEMTATMLRNLGYTVLAAEDPLEALEKCAQYDGRIDLLLSDVIMPRMNGRDLAVRLLQLHPGSKCLYMSGYTADIIAHQGVLDEGIHFLQKPFSHATLAAKVREALADTTQN